MGLFGKKPTCTFALSVSPETVLPGETITVDVTVTDGPDPKLASMHLILEAPVAVSHDEAPAGTYGSVETHQDVTHHREIVDGPTTPGTHRYTFVVPPDAPPFAMTNGMWAANWRVLLTGRGNRYYLVEAPVRVRRRDAVGPGRDALPALVTESSDAATVHATVPRRLRAGVTVAGTVRVQATRDIELRAVVLQLTSYLVRRFTAPEPLPLDPVVRHSDLPPHARVRTNANLTKRIELPPTRLAAGQGIDVPVEYRVPDEDWPTFTNGLARTHWVLRIAADVADGKDPEIALELEVCNA